LALIVFLTGMPGVGKSTVVKHVAEEVRRRGIKVGGMTSGDLRSGSTRVGFEIRDLLTNQAGVLAHVGQSVGPRIGRFRVNSKDLDMIGVAAISSAIRDADLVVIDEVGPMELTSTRFKDVVQAALSCGKPVLGTVHRNARDPMIRQIKSTSGIEVTEVTHENRSKLAATIAERFKAE
jgi:nucleoside-triphosphatase